MIRLIEALYKSTNSILFGWRPEPSAGPGDTYNVYVSSTPSVSGLQKLVSGIPNIPDNSPASQGRITYKASIDSVKAVLTGTPASADFSNKVFYFEATAVINGTEDATTAANIVQIPPVGIIPKFMKDDPTMNRHGYVFNDDNQRWVKMAGSPSGAVVTDAADFYKSNITTVYTYDGTNLSTIKSYLSDATTSGSAAKLTTYTYSGSQVSKIVVTDTTV